MIKYRAFVFASAVVVSFLLAGGNANNEWNCGLFYGNWNNSAGNSNWNNGGAQHSSHAHRKCEQT